MRLQDHGLRDDGAKRQRFATANPSEGRTHSLFQSKLLANRPRKNVFYLCVPWDRHRPAVYRICVKIVVRAVPLQITAAFSETSYELSAASQRDRHFVSFLWNERALGCILHHQPVSISNHRLEFLERFALAHHGGHFF